MAKPKAEPSKLVPDLALLQENFGVLVNGCVRSWKAGQPVTDQNDISLLWANNAPATYYNEALL